MYYQRISYLEGVHETVHSILLQEPIEVAVLKHRFPNLDGVQISFERKIKLPVNFNMDHYVQELCDTFTMKSFRFDCIGLSRLPTSLWTSKLIYLHLYLVDNLNLLIEIPNNFKNHLETLYITSDKRIIPLPSKLLCSTHLKDVNLSGIDSVKGLHQACRLEQLQIGNYSNAKLDLQEAVFPCLQSFSLCDCPNLKALPNFTHWQALESLYLAKLPALQTLNNDWDALQNLKSFMLIEIGSYQRKSLTFKELPHLEHIYIVDMSIDEQAPFLGKMPLLQTIQFTGIDWTFIPMEGDFPVLTAVSVERCASLVKFPDILFRLPYLNRLSILKCQKLFLPKEILLLTQLEHLSYDFPHYAFEGLELSHLQYYLLSELRYFPLPSEQQLAIGQLFLEGYDAITDWMTFKSAFWQLLQTKQAVFKPFVYRNLHWLNPKQQKYEIPNSYKGKSIALLGKMHKAKNLYKKKLIALNFDYQSVVKAETELIIVGTGLELPAHFWSYPHYFFTEQDLEAFLTETNPDFLQHLEDIESESMRALLWSNDVANDRLVMEMVYSGGIPTNLLPELVLVAKTSSDETVKMNLRKLLKAKVAPNVQKIISNKNHLYPRSHFYEYAELAPDFDVAQMMICHYKRTGHFAEEFFQLPNVMTHPFRQEMLLAAFKSPKNQDIHCRWRRWRFTDAEINQILPNMVYVYQFDSLEVHCVGDTILTTHFDLLKVRNLSIYFEGQSIEMNSLLKFSEIRIHAKNLKTLSINILDIKRYHIFYIYTEEAIQLPIAFKGITQWEIVPEPIYIK